MYRLSYSKKALKDLEEYKKAGEKEELRKVSELLLELATHPESGEGKVEELHTVPGEPELKDANGRLWSRRISHEDRLVYVVDTSDQSVEVMSMRGHYGDH